MTDYYHCEECGRVFDEFEMDYRAAQEDKRCLCATCRSAETESPTATTPAGERDGEEREG